MKEQSVATKTEPGKDRSDSLSDFAVRTFPNFPKQSTCPLCGTNQNATCFLAPVDGTEDGNNCEAVPVHLHCMMEHAGRFRVSRDPSVFYCVVEVSK